MAFEDSTSTNFSSLENINRLIHEPARLMIVSLLSVVESADFIFLMRQTGLTKGNLSSHLSKLEAAGYVIIEKEFIGKIPRTFLQLSEKGRDAFDAYQLQIKSFLQDLS